MPHRLVIVVSIVASALSLSCGTAQEESVQVCTLIGCENGLTLDIMGTLPTTYTVIVRADGQVAATVECSPSRPCQGGLFVRDVTAARVEVQITGTGVNMRRDVTPTYTMSRPNGPNCPPECKQARVRIDV